MKIVLTAAEVSRIIVDHLALQGRIEKDKAADVTWRVDRFGAESTTIVVEQ